MRVWLMLAAFMTTSAHANEQSKPIGLTRTVQIAETAIAGTVTDAELDSYRDGSLVYEVELV